MMDFGKSGADFDLNAIPAVGGGLQYGNNAVLKHHEIYGETDYVPNTQLRLMEIPMTSSLTFQKMLYYHATYDIVYTVLMVGGIVHKMRTRD